MSDLRAVRLRFGKYFGTKVIDLPDEYVEWLYERRHTLPETVRTAVTTEYNARFMSDATEMPVHEMLPPRGAE